MTKKSEKWESAELLGMLVHAQNSIGLMFASYGSQHAGNFLAATDIVERQIKQLKRYVARIKLEENG